MDATPLPVRPADVPVGDATLSAVVAPGPDGTHWDVTALVVRPPDQAPLPASAVTAELHAGGRPLALVSRDEGDLVEAGGSLGVTANASFRFAAAADGAAPDRLRVTYRGTPVDFAVTSGP